MSVDAPAPAPAPAESRPGEPREARRGFPLRTVLGLGAVAILMARVTVHAAARLDNADTWFHLRLGEQFIQGSWSLQHPGRLSSFASSAWVPTQWSTEAVMAEADRWFGLPGVAWMYGVLYLALVVIAFATLRARGDLLPAALGTGIVVLASGSSLSARPQVVSLVLFTLTLASWLRAERSGSVPWLLVPLTWVWATAHGLWTAAVLLGLVSVVGIVLDRRPGVRQTLFLLAVPVLSVVAACLTPVGPRLLTSQLAVGTRTSFIPEWGAPSFRDPVVLLVALMAAGVVVAWSRAGRRVPWTPLLQVLLGVAWVALVLRMLPFGALLVAPALVAALSAVPASVPVAPGGAGRTRRAEPYVLPAVAVVCAVMLALVVPSTARSAAGVPDHFGARLRSLPAGSPVLVQDGSGSWIEWRYPRLDPVIDGMLDAYPVRHIADFYAYRSLLPGWHRFVSDSHAHVALLERGSSLSAAMVGELGWRPVQRDATWVYLVAPGAPD